MEEEWNSVMEKYKLRDWRYSREDSRGASEDIQEHEAAVTIEDMQRPPYSNAELAAMAIMNSQDMRCTIHEICNFMDSHFPYFRKVLKLDKKALKVSIHGVMYNNKSDFIKTADFERADSGHCRYYYTLSPKGRRKYTEKTRIDATRKPSWQSHKESPHKATSTNTTSLVATVDSPGGETNSAPKRRELPLYAYLELAALAIRNSAEMRCTIPEICNFVEAKFPYYRKWDRNEAAANFTSVLHSYDGDFNTRASPTRAGGTLYYYSFTPSGKKKYLNAA